MKKLIAICIFLVASIGYSQDIQPTFSAEGDLVKATYYYNNGTISTQGYFKNKQLTGEWTRFDIDGNKTEQAYYEAGKKVGTWLVYSNESIKEITYKNNVVAQVNVIRDNTKLAVNK